MRIARLVLLAIVSSGCQGSLRDPSCGQNTASASDKKPIALMFIGDSITAGEAIRGRAEAADITVTYGHELAKRVGAKTLDLGVPGGRASEILPRLMSLQNTNDSARVPPDVVFINVGANDREVDASLFAGQMRRLVDLVVRVYPRANVVLLNFFRMTPNRLPSLQALAESYPAGHVRCFDARRYLVGYSDRGTHPNVESHRRLAEALSVELLPKMLDPKQAASSAKGYGASGE